MIPPVEMGCQHRHSDSRASPDPDEMWVDDSRGDDLAEGRGQRIGEQEERHDEGLHVAWRAGVCELVGGHVAEAFGEGAEGDIGDLQPDV